jgi:hypothetical protein
MKKLVSILFLALSAGAAVAQPALATDKQNFAFVRDAAPLAVGDAVPAISAKDQHGTEFIFTNQLQFLLVATEMACAKAANQKLAGQGAGFLESHHAAYLMDIHTMPGVARFFALPKMRKYPHRIVLVDSAATLAGFPAQPGRVTVLALTPAGRIQKIGWWNPEREPASACFQ